MYATCYVKGELHQSFKKAIWYSGSMGGFERSGHLLMKDIVALWGM